MDKSSSVYKRVKRDADEKFKNHGIYKSAWIVREYKKRGGIFKGQKPSENTGLQRWFKEDWVRIDKNGKAMKKADKIVPCGRSTKETQKNVKKGLCRPLKKITKDTPKTIKELGPKILKDRYKRKKKNPNKIIQ